MTDEGVKLRVWVREPDPSLERAIAALLRDEGYHVLVGAVTRPEVARPDVLVLGIPAASDAPRPSRIAAPAVLLASGAPLAELAEWFSSPGRRIVLWKPVRERDLLSAVRRAGGGQA